MRRVTLTRTLCGLEPWFEALHRGPPVPFSELARLPHWVAAVADDAGVAAAVLVLDDPQLPCVRLIVRREDPVAEPAAVHAAIEEALAEAAKRGRRLALLGLDPSSGGAFLLELS
jgi:hypothetical protein